MAQQHLHLQSLLSLGDFLPPSGGDPALDAAAAALPPLPPGAQHVLLAGPPRCGKTSLLFLAARALAARGAAVLLLARREALEGAPPLLGAGASPADPAWARVHIKYVASAEELLRFAAAMHLLPAQPDAVLVDGLPPPAPRGGGGGGARDRDAAACRVLAVLRDAAEHAARARGRPCPLVLAAEAAGGGDWAAPGGGGGGGVSPYLTQRWLPAAVTLAQAGGAGGGAGGPVRLALGGAAVPPEQRWAADVAMRHGALVLCGVYPPGALPAAPAL